MNKKKFGGIKKKQYLCVLFCVHMRIRQCEHISKEQVRMVRRRMLTVGLMLIISTIASWAEGIDHPISYEAKDSIVLMGNGKASLHGSSKVNYQSMELTSEYIQIHSDSNLIYACGVLDTAENEWIGRPVFTDQGDSYESHEITYNMKTQKGFIKHVVTEQGEGYVTAEKTKKASEKDMMMAGGKYTTCNHHDHPHFYLKMTRAKVRPGKDISTGPAYMVVGDVPLPLVIPFGFFPFTDTYSSGLIMPTFGDDYERGFYLKNIGYYFAISDYVDLELTGDIYTRGTWAIYGRSHYKKRYKFSGNISINYRSDVLSEPTMPDYQKHQNFNIVWTHTQDAKANPYCNFSASVNFSTSGYNRSNINSYYNAVLNSENTKASSISYTQRFPESPWSITASLLVSQRTKDSTLNLTLPDIAVNMSRIYPFKRKKPVGKERWYEKISLSYSGAGKIAASNMKERAFATSNFLRDWQSGLNHKLSTNATFMLFKYLSVTPNISLTDRMYFTRIDQHWDEEQQRLARDTTDGFYNVFDFNVGLSLSTKIYGFYTPYRKWFPNSRLEKVRHIITPTVSITYHPDFGTSWWNYYGYYDETVYDGIDLATNKKKPKLDGNGNPMTVSNRYNKFQHGLYGNAPDGMAATLTFGVDNNVEMKLQNRKDTTGKEPYKIYSIIDNIGIHGAYNFAADSMNWSNFTVNLRLKIPKVNYTINLSGQFDPYMYELNAAGKPVRTNKQYWHHGKFPHFLGTSASLSYTFNNQTLKKWFGLDKKDKNKNEDDGNMEPVTINEHGTVSNGKRKDESQQTSTIDDDGYERVEIPWSLSVSYSIRYAPGSDFDYDKMYYRMQLTHNLCFSATIGLGQGWKVSATTSYDFQAKQFSYTNFTVNRDLHCWNMSASFVPFGPYKSYTFHIGVNASMLADLKYDKSSVDNTNKPVNWW